MSDFQTGPLNWSWRTNCLSCLLMTQACPRCKPPPHLSETRTTKKSGFFRRRSDQKWIQRFRCIQCKKAFSVATFEKCYHQRKRHLNQSIFELLCSGNSQRRISYLLRINRKTVNRKFLFLGAESFLLLKKFNLRFPRSTEIEFDDLETFEHTKCKPLSVTLAVESRSRRILGFEVSVMPTKGLLVYKALKKYGPRKDERREGRYKLLSSLKDLVAEHAVIKSDQNPHYPEDIKKYFPEISHITFKGKRGAITGQGELKKIHFDPLFSLNHTCAKLRADVNRLIRKTWCTTKKIERLRLHLAMSAVYHNTSLYAPKRA